MASGATRRRERETTDGRRERSNVKQGSLFDQKARFSSHVSRLTSDVSRFHIFAALTNLNFRAENKYGSL